MNLLLLDGPLAGRSLEIPYDLACIGLLHVSAKYIDSGSGVTSTRVFSYAVRNRESFDTLPVLGIPVPFVYREELP